jgi:serine phosphatase RsbU (regulator of sigma subunit)
MFTINSYISSLIRKLFLLALILTIIIPNAFSQVKNLGIPYFKNYTVEDYKASKQNWMAAQDKRGVLYFGNNMGVLEYDGHDWNIIPLTEKARVVRAVYADKNGRIYVGSDREFGYLAPDSIGQMKYNSLTDKIEKEEDRNFIGINYINGIEDKIYFSGNEYLFEYSNGKITTYNIEKLRQTGIINGRIFIRISEQGLFELKNGKITPIKDGDKYKDISLRTILQYDNKIMFVTMENGLLAFDENEIYEIELPISSFLKKNKIISGIQLNDGNYAFGLLSEGLIIVTKKGEVIQHIDTRLGLPSDLILSIFQSSDNNLWLCTGNGLFNLLSSLPITNYDSHYSLNAATYSSLLFDNTLYVASQIGVFKRRWGVNENHLNQLDKFSRIGEPNNAVNLYKKDNTLLIATNRGLSEIKDGKIKDLNIETIAFWKFLEVGNAENLLIAGTSVGLKLLEFKEKKKKWPKKKKNSKPDGNWSFKKDIKGFKEKCRHIEIDNQNNIWGTNQSTGIFKLVPSPEFDSVTVINYNENKGITDPLNSFIFKIKDKIVIGTNNGLFYYDQAQDLFVEHEELNSIIGKEVKVWIMKEDSLGNIWYKLQRKIKHSGEDVFEMGQLILQDNDSYLNYKTPFYKFKNNIYSINPLGDGEIIIGTAKGFVHYDPKLEKDYSTPYRTLIRKVEFVLNDSLLFDGAFLDSAGYVGSIQPESQTYQIPYELNDLRFTFSAPFFDSPDEIVYKFYLEGNDDEWTDWKTKNFKEYSNLDPGEYTFRIKAKNIYEIESQEASYYFIILPPWYRTTWAFISYFILFILLIWGIVRLSVRRLRKQKEYLEKVVKERTSEIRMKNEELEQQKEEILAQRDEIEAQKDKIEDKNKNITASITYAKRIQEAMLPLKDKIEQTLDDYFILFKPRDIVSGDFYWFAQKNDKIIFTAVDCTGHGVPGAFMSMIGSEILTTIVNQGITTPSEILDYKNRYVRKALKQEQTDNQDGMDMSLCAIDKHNKIVEWAGAKNPLVYIQNKELFHLKGDMQSIGGHQLVKKAEKKFTNHKVSYADAVTYFYIFSDGFQDQFGGPKGRKFMVKKLKELIYDNHQKPMKEQYIILNAAIENWMKNVEQTDDILVIGFKLIP